MCLNFSVTYVGVPYMPQRSAIAALRSPLSGSAPWARRDGPSMAQHASPGFLPGGPLRKTYARPSEGACRSKAKQKRCAFWL